MSTSKVPSPFACKRILACVSEGAFSDDAIEAACLFGQRLGAEVALLHVLPVPPTLGTKFDSRQIEAMNLARAEETLAAKREHLARRFPDLALRGRPVAELLEVVPGVPTRTVLEEARRREADLIVLGDNGKRRQLDFGGTARAVLAKARAPVLLQRCRPVPIERLLVPVDLSPSSVLVLARAIDLAARLGASLLVLHAVEQLPEPIIGVSEAFRAPPTDRGTEALENAHRAFATTLSALDWRGLEHELILARGTAAQVILARQAEADLIVMGTHGHTGLAAALLGGVAYHVMREAHTPVLALRDEKRAFLF